MNRLKNYAMAAALWLLAISAAMAKEQIVLEGKSTALVFTVGDNHRLYQSYLGARLLSAADYAQLPLGGEAFLTGGMEDYFEPALAVVHADDNPATVLEYRAHTTTSHEGYAETVIALADPVYGDEVDLHFAVFMDEDVFKEWAVVRNKEKSSIRLDRYASALLHMSASRYFLTQYDGDWASEVHQHTQQLQFGRKELSTKLGARANMFAPPFFEVSLDAPATETQGTVLTGTLGWTGNFSFSLEVDNKGGLRILSGINPYASSLTLQKGETFSTPEFIFTLSQEGYGKASRNLHDWARRYQLKDGMGQRMTLLNNWEATYFDFDEEKLITLISDAKRLGVDMFLLDDGWFGNKYPRKDDTQGLGDWQETRQKLPNGIRRLTEEAKRQGVKFGLWIEPEMVSPKSVLYEQHKDWVITLPNREEYYFRNQLVLDLANPKVQDYVFGVVDALKTQYPDIAFFKWDCNSPITNIYSNYEKNRQSHLYVDYVRGLYKVLQRIQTKYPDLPMMLCSGGGGRTDYEALRYFPEMWVSDNTDPVERLFIQWGYSHVFPAKTQCAHVTTWNKKAGIKFRVNVAMMGLLGFDINLHELSEGEFNYCRRSVADYNRLKPVILDGDQYRLVSPYDGNHTATMFVSKPQDRAVLMAYDIHPRYGERLDNVRLQGLDQRAVYEVREVNRGDAEDRTVVTCSGDYLMKVGLPLFTHTELASRVYEIIRKYSDEPTMNTRR